MLELFDIIIIGGGPAGLAAGVYAGRARLKTLIIEKGSLGGNAFTTRELVNYPGYKSSTGPELMKAMGEHAQSFGVQIVRDEVKSVDFSGQIKILKSKKNEYHAKAVIIGTGTQSRVLGIPGEKELRGQGVAYCATCDAEFFEDQHVVVVGSGDQAIEEGMYIAKFASKITVIVLHDEGILDCNKVSAEKAFNHPKMNFIWNSVLDSIVGEEEVEAVKVKNLKTGEITDLPCQGVFFFVGMVPQTDFLKGHIQLDPRGYVHTNDRMETSVEGVYAVGDIRDKYLRQVSTAVGDGATAAVAAERYIEEQDEFRTNVLEADQPVLLGFWTPEYNDSLERIGKVDEANRAMGQKYKVIEIDVSRKKGLAIKYGIQISAACSARVLELNRGEVVRELDLEKDLEKQL